MKIPTKKFLKLPEYPGGKEAFRKYINENLIYPREALKKQIHGIVYINAEINDNGDVIRVFVEKGIGAGCDEEAIRLINNIQFIGVKNRGVRVKTIKKFRVDFKPQQQKEISYNFVKTKSVEKKNETTKNYLYTININQK